jgi:hypothetical protein
METKRTADPWERQPGESSKAFSAFQIYLNMGIDRSIRKAVAQLVEAEGPWASDLAKARRFFSRRDALEGWSVRWHWVERVEAYDDELLREKRLSNEKAQRLMLDRHAAISTLILNKSVERLREAAPEEMSLRLAIEGAKIGADMERQARGLPAKVEVTGENGAAIPVRLNLQETLEQICVFYGLDPKIARPQRERLAIDTTDVAPMDSIGAGTGTTGSPNGDKPGDDEDGSPDRSG